MQAPITKYKLSQRLAMKLRSDIENGQLVPGSRLPATRELARKYEVSQNTVQGAFRELEALDLIECRPRRRGYVKLSASGGRPGKSSTALRQIAIISRLGSVSSSLAADNWADRIIKAAERVLSEAEYNVTMMLHYTDAPESPQKLVSRVEKMIEHLNGVVLMGLNDLENRSLLNLLDAREIPWVSIKPLSRDVTHNFVAANNLECGRIVGRCFARLAYNRVLLLYSSGGPDNIILSDVEKMAGFARGYIELEAPLDGVRQLPCEGYKESSGYEKVLEYLDSHEPPQGIFAKGDLLAIGAIRACRERGLDVPGQVGVVGSTGLALAQYSHPSLTVITQPMEQMGAQAARMLMEMVRKGVRRMPGRMIDGKLIVRDSLRLNDELRCEIESGGCG